MHDLGMKRESSAGTNRKGNGPGRPEPHGHRPNDVVPWQSEASSRSIFDRNEIEFLVTDTHEIHHRMLLQQSSGHLGLRISESPIAVPIGREVRWGAGEHGENTGVHLMIEEGERRENRVVQVG